MIMIIIMKEDETMTLLKTMRSTLVCGLLIALSFAFPQNLQTIILILAIILGGAKQTAEGIQDTLEHRRMNVELLMILSAIGAVLIQEAFEGATLIFIFSLSGELETLTSDRSRQAIQQLMSRQPQTARRVIGDATEIVATEAVAVGDQIIVLNGESIPLDSVVVTGTSDVDESMINGEPLPVFKKADDTVYAGTLNITGPMTLSVIHESKDALLQKIIDLVDNAEKHQSKAARKIEKIESYYATAVLVVVALVFTVLRFGLNLDVHQAMYRSIILLVVASPCALIAAVTPATLAAIANAARQGILIKGGTYLEQVSDVKAVAFDKTGTLTLGKPAVVSFFMLDDTDATRRLIKTLESSSIHPLAAAICTYLGDMSPMAGLDTIREVSGQGMVADFAGQAVCVGKYQAGDWHPLLVEKANESLAQGNTLVAYYANGICQGIIGIQDRLRDEAKTLIDALNQQGVVSVMITGDHEQSAQNVAQKLGLTRVVANCLPQDKVTVVNALQEEFASVMMLGDGINDAPALATAAVGVSVGSGTDIAMESADIVIMNSNLNNVSYIFNLSQKLKKITHQNILFALGVIVVLVTLNILGVINLPLAVIGHEGSTILVILNGMRMLSSLSQ